MISSNPATKQILATTFAKAAATTRVSRPSVILPLTRVVGIGAFTTSRNVARWSHTNHHYYSHLALRSFSTISNISAPSSLGDNRNQQSTVTTTTTQPQQPSSHVFISSQDPRFSSLQALDVDTVRKIQAELAEVDINSDGRIDANELKLLLRKHNAAFTDQEIVEIGELFYAGKAGESVSMDRFIQAIDQAALQAEIGRVPQHFKKSLSSSSSSSPSDSLGLGRCSSEYMYFKSHGNYTDADLNIKLTHVEPDGLRDKLAFKAVKAVRFLFDTATGWKQDNVTVDRVLNRVIFLETVAAVPGMVAAAVAHFRSLRRMERNDNILMFLEEATNERMHLLTFVKMKDPSTLFRLAVIGGQFGFGSLFLLSYMISPKFCHRFVGYIEEEACSTYTKIIHAIETAPEDSDLARWKYQLAPKIARSYWKMGETGTVLDLMYAVRADEAEHRDVNHLVSTMKHGQANPLHDPAAKLDMTLVKFVKDLMTRDAPLVPPTAAAATAVGGTGTTVGAQ